MSSMAELALRRRARRSQTSDVRRGRASPQTSGEAETALEGRARRTQPSDVGRDGARPQTSGEAEPALGGRARRSHPSGVSQGRANPLGSGETRPAAAAPTEAEPTLGGQTRQGPPPRWPDDARPGKRCSRALDRADESTLMAISYSSSGTLVLVPDTSKYTYLLVDSVKSN